MTKKESLKKVWNFIWNDDSLASWLVNIVIAFVLIKFIVYPGLGFILNTPFPIVAVVSGSMEHDGSFDDWWGSEALCGSARCSQGEYYKQFDISKDDFKSYAYKNGFNIGDIMILYGTQPKDLKKGDVLVFQGNRIEPIIHRIIATTTEDGKHIYQTKGDHNTNMITEFEQRITQERLYGRAVFRIPYLGYIKIGAVKGVCLFGDFRFCL